MFLFFDKTKQNTSFRESPLRKPLEQVVAVRLKQNKNHASAVRWWHHLEPLAQASTGLFSCTNTLKPKNMCQGVGMSWLSCLSWAPVCWDWDWDCCKCHQGARASGLPATLPIDAAARTKRCVLWFHILQWPHTVLQKRRVDCKSHIIDTRTQRTCLLEVTQSTAADVPLVMLAFTAI